jgi:cell division GTPase FtsZ
MRANSKKIENQFSVSMIIGSNLEIINDKNLKRISASLTKVFSKTEKLLAGNEILSYLSGNKPLFTGFAIAYGQDRAKKVIELALLTPLQNDAIIENTNTVLLHISSHLIEINLKEIGEITDYIQYKMGTKATITINVSEDTNLEVALAIIIVLSE